MAPSSAPDTPPAADQADPREELREVLELAGQERTGAVLSLLRELLSMPAPEPAGPDLLTLDQVAKRCQVHPRTIRRSIETGDLEAVQLPIRGGLRVRASTLEDWIAKHTGAEPVSPAHGGRRRPAAKRRSGRLELSDV